MGVADALNLSEVRPERQTGAFPTRDCMENVKQTNELVVSLSIGERETFLHFPVAGSKQPMVYIQLIDVIPQNKCAVSYYVAPICNDKSHATS